MIYFLGAIEDRHSTDEDDFVVLSPVVFPAPSIEAAEEIARSAAEALGLSLVDEPIPIWWGEGSLDVLRASAENPADPSD